MWSERHPQPIVGLVVSATMVHGGPRLSPLARASALRLTVVLMGGPEWSVEFVRSHRMVWVSPSGSDDVCRAWGTDGG